MKIICCDNFDRDGVDEREVLCGLTLPACKIRVEYLNKTMSGPKSPFFYRVEGEDYIPHRFVPDVSDTRFKGRRLKT